MKRLSMIAGLFCLMAVVAANAADANFAGTWALDKAKSENVGGRPGGGGGGGGDQTWTITQDAKTLTVETKMTTQNGDRTSKTVFNLDGTETSADVERGQMKGKSTSKAKWGEGNKTLETSTEFVGKRGETDVKNTTKDKWELGDEGKVLTITRVREGGPNGAQNSKLVLTKK